MIEPTRIGAALLQAVDRHPVPVGSVAVWPLGQSGLLLRFPSARVYVDLYLSNHCEAVLARPFDHRRTTRAPMDPAEIRDADVVICTHDHLDHLDVPTMRTLASASPDAVVVAPQSCRSTLLALDWPAGRIVGTRGDDTVTVGSLTVTAFPVPHDEYDEDPTLAFPYQGYLVTDGHVSVAHVGDSRLDDLLAQTLRRLAPDLVCLPINGRDERRKAMGFAGNMSAAEAKHLARAAGAAHVLPMHYDMFEQNVDPDALATFMAMSASDPGGPAVVRPAVGDGVLVSRG